MKRLKILLFALAFVLWTLGLSLHWGNIRSFQRNPLTVTAEVVR